jgi:sugar O-acyltransferase (sialic acid O-acetyltransferase NeuD family)
MGARGDGTAADLILLGAGGGVHDVLDIVDAINGAGGELNVLGVLDDHRAVGERHLGLEVLGGLSACDRFPDARFLSTIHNERIHGRTPAILAGLGVGPERFATLIDPRAGVSRRATVGAGTFICDGASIGGGAAIGEHASIGPHAVVGHDSRLESHCVLAAGSLLGGLVTVGTAAYIGSSAAVRPSVSIGAGALVGLGAVVIRDVADGEVVVGNPARPLRRG